MPMLFATLLPLLTALGDPRLTEPEPLTKRDLPLTRLNAGFAKDDFYGSWLGPRFVFRFDPPETLGTRLPVPYMAFTLGAKARLHPWFWLEPNAALQFRKDPLTETDTPLGAVGFSAKFAPSEQFGLTADLAWIADRGRFILHGYESLDTYLWAWYLPGIGVQAEHWDDRLLYGPHLRLGGDSIFIEGQLFAGDERGLGLRGGRVLLSFIFEDLAKDARDRNRYRALFGSRRD